MKIINQMIFVCALLLDTAIDSAALENPKRNNPSPIFMFRPITPDDLTSERRSPDERPVTPDDYRKATPAIRAKQDEEIKSLLKAALSLSVNNGRGLLMSLLNNIKPENKAKVQIIKYCVSKFMEAHNNPESIKIFMELSEQTENNYIRALADDALWHIYLEGKFGEYDYYLTRDYAYNVITNKHASKALKKAARKIRMEDVSS